MVKGKFRGFNHKGPSMNPTLKAGDRLMVAPYGDAPVRPGDVIVFRASGRKRHVTHRVVSVDVRGVRTKGDNNSKTDSWVLHPDEITGRVVSAHRGAKNIPIHGGRRGVLQAGSLRFIRQADSTVSRLSRPVYRRLAAAGIFRRALPLKTQPRVFCFTRPNGVEMQVLMGNRVIGRRRPGEPWRVRRPFRLFVDEASLPD